VHRTSLHEGGSATELSVTGNSQGARGDDRECPFRRVPRWSILTSFENLMAVIPEQRVTLAQHTKRKMTSLTATRERKLDWRDDLPDDFASTSRVQISGD
jgi:hypothetical protein